MSNIILILGYSGTGKSSSLRNLDAATSALIQPIPKKLPFRNPNWQLRHTGEDGGRRGNITVSDNPTEIIRSLRGYAKEGREVIVIDDFQYIMANEYMRQANVKGFEKFTTIGKNAWDIVNAAQELPGDIRVYILSHLEQNEFGREKMKTIGKLLDDKIVMEGLFTVVLKTLVEDGKYYFRTHNSGNDSVKAPIGMFEDSLLDNDLSILDNVFCEYYSLH